MVYLDNAANAPVFPEVLEAMLPWLRPDHVGNPGSSIPKVSKLVKLLKMPAARSPK